MQVNSLLLNADSIGYKALKYLSSARKTAKVHSVFNHAFYIQSGRNSFIRVVKDENYISPASILVKDFTEDFNSIGIKEGTQIEIKGRSLIFDNNALTISLGKSSTWASPSPPKQKDIIGLSSIGLNLRVLRDVIYTCPNKEGLVPLLQNVELLGPQQLFLKPQKHSFAETARPNIDNLMWGLFRNEFDTVTSQAISILGLGPGLTPSCDDFLAGLILSLIIGGKVLLTNELSFYKKVSSEITRAAKKKTTIYSQMFLNGAARGEAPKAIVELVHSLLTKEPNQVIDVSKIVIKMGETSGADIAIGIYYGIRFMLSRLELSQLERDINELA